MHCIATDRRGSVRMRVYASDVRRVWTGRRGCRVGRGGWLRCGPAFSTQKFSSRTGILVLIITALARTDMRNGGVACMRLSSRRTFRPCKRDGEHAAVR